MNNLPNEWLTDDSWYKHNIELPVREIVKNLRNQGINTECSCGHALYIQCQTIDTNREIDTIFNVLVTMGIKKYKVDIYIDYNEDRYNKCIEICLPDQNGNYYNRSMDNPEYIQQRWEQ